MIEIDIRIVLDTEDTEFSTVNDLAEKVFNVVARAESAKKLWEIGTFHDSFISKIRTKDGVILKNKFSYLKEDQNLDQKNHNFNELFNPNREFPYPTYIDE